MNTDHRLRVYCASKARNWPWWQALEAAGVNVQAPWIHAAFNATGEEPTEQGWAQHWDECLRAAAACDVCLLYAEADTQQRGALVELGAALAHGKRAYIVSPHPWSWKYHPQVTVFETLGKAVRAILEEDCKRARSSSPET